MNEAIQLSVEAIDEISKYVKQSRVPDLQLSDFQSAREQNDMQALHAIAQQLFATCRTSLLTIPLDGIPSHPDLRKYIKSLHIQDECDKVDPWVCDGTVESQYIWPRNKAILNISPTTAGAESLKNMLFTKQICPDTITVEDYAISPNNVQYCTERTKHQLADYHIDRYAKDHNGPVAALARRIIDGADLAVLSVSMQSDTVEIGEINYLNAQHIPGCCIGDPTILRMKIELSAADQGQGLGFSRMKSAQLKDNSYWLERVLHYAPELETLSLSSIDETIFRTAIHGNLQLSNVKELTLYNINMDAGTMLAMVTNCSSKLTKLFLREIVLNPGSTWKSFLPILAETLPVLSNFSFVSLKERTDDPTERSDAVKRISFLGFDKDMVPEECREGLILTEKGRLRGGTGNVRLTKVQYEGPHTGVVLKGLAEYAHWHRDTVFSAVFSM